VDDIMIDKVSGKAIYALMSFGGFLGIGAKYHPLPWSTLKYDEKQRWLPGESRQTDARRRANLRHG
jgi:hypothetical protein